MEFKGTKGQWEVLEYKKDLEIGNQLSALVCRLPDKSEEYTANALLISKAPELLEMLNKIVFMTSVCEGTFADFRERYNVEIERLIKQATDINYAKEDTDS